MNCKKKLDFYLLINNSFYTFAGAYYIKTKDYGWTKHQ